MSTTYPQYYSQPTIGVDFYTINKQHNDDTYQVQLWDTAGIERFSSLTPSYLKDVYWIVITFDVTGKTV